MPSPFSVSSLILLAGIVLFFTSTPTQADEENIEALTRFNVEQKPITVSGFSSGGNMAIQLQVGFSSQITGSACFESIWYRCAPGGEDDYRTRCSLGLTPVANGIRDAKKFASEGKIDSLENMQNGKHWHYIANQDFLVRDDPQIRAKTKTFFEGVGMDPKNIELVFRNSDHWMPTENKSYTSCSSSLLTNVILPNKNTSGISYCNYYGAFEGLKYIYNGALERPSGSIELQPLRAFDQSAFLDENDQKFMDKVGYFYVPSQCQGSSSTPCRFHIAMHGCRGSRSSVGTAFIVGSGYLEVAEANNIVMLLPQSTPFEGNRGGCWDIFGASNSETYATKDGVQMKALRKMIETSTGLSLG